ncbi:Na+/H+ antiporter NhaA [Chryseobacterium sp. BIGb0232]|uniref:Na+/H+ antiporter NhaA n=1 Tax=Chryseobacterium sp. BIGb0232 TaxID=2940598 RepID=UPI000F48778D|nr:Na+/H+ antiporter NhaA [Chryseobacterium sp. BIGb0232]MCS4302445.1 Na+/H+ antiporter NhaA [Chryseobacterium sp. BIGb0232]ROS18387.1 Na+/H+ antiporter 1 [Chryseobacterium nakagawai]
MQRSIQQDESGVLLLGISVILALIVANSLLPHTYHAILEQSFGVRWKNETYFE